MPNTNAALAGFRAQYPEYADMSDEELAGRLHQKFYPDLSAADFNRRIRNFKVQAPDGSIIKVEAPADASEEDVIAFAQQNWKPKQAASPKPAPRPQPSSDNPMGLPADLQVTPENIANAADLKTRRRMESEEIAYQNERRAKAKLSTGAGY